MGEIGTGRHFVTSSCLHGILWTAVGYARVLNQCQPYSPAGALVSPNLSCFFLVMLFVLNWSVQTSVRAFLIIVLWLPVVG